MELARWAEANGLMLDGEEFERRWKEAGEEEGAENRVYACSEDGKTRWRKANAATFNRTWDAYFARIALHNALFPEASYSFLGFIVPQTGPLAGVLQAVVSQADVEVKGGAELVLVKPAQVDALMKLAGFERIPGTDNDYYNPTSGLFVGDLHDENVLVGVDGKLKVIDPDIVIPEWLDYTQGGMLGPRTIGVGRPATRRPVG
jgi:hypothetical protein